MDGTGEVAWNGNMKTADTPFQANLWEEKKKAQKQGENKINICIFVKL